MGNWGCEPRHGDAPWDATSKVEAAGMKVLEAAFKKKIQPAAERRDRRPGEKLRNRRLNAWDRWERLGLLQIVSEVYQWAVPLRLAKVALEDLEIVLRDEGFMRNWRDERKARRQIEGMIAALKEEIEIVERRPVRFRRRAKRNAHKLPEPRIYPPVFGGSTMAGSENFRRHSFPAVKVKTVTVKGKKAAVLKNPA